jgi:hypothetical protein
MLNEELIWVPQSMPLRGAAAGGGARLQLGRRHGDEECSSAAFRQLSSHFFGVTSHYHR